MNRLSVVGTNYFIWAFIGRIVLFFVFLSLWISSFFFRLRKLKRYHFMLVQQSIGLSFIYLIVCYLFFFSFISMWISVCIFSVLSLSRHVEDNNEPGSILLLYKKYFYTYALHTSILWLYAAVFFSSKIHYCI